MELVRLGILFLGGIIGGFYGSTVGGGLLISFPLLILLGLPTHFALGTQRFGAVLGELSGAIKFHTAKKLKVKLAIALGIIASLGSIVGVTLVIHISENILNFVIGLMLLIVAYILFHKDRLGIKEHTLTHKHLVLLLFCTFPLGIYGGFFGVGFGVFIAMFLVLFGFSFIESAAMGRVIGFLMSVTSTIVFAQQGFVNYTYGITLGLGFAIGAWIGITITLKKEEKYIKYLILFITFLSLIKFVLNFFNIKISGINII